jgi:hypothetical protein
LQGATFYPSESGETFAQTGKLGLYPGVVRSSAHQHTDPPHSLALLRARRERPGDRRAAYERDELATM